GVDGRTHTRVEQVGFQEDLAVGDRDHVGGHESRHVACLGFDDRQRGQRAGLALDGAVGELLDVFFVDARGTLEQARVQVEHVTRVGFAARRTAQQQRYLAVGPGLLGQVVVNDQGVLAAIAEVLAHGAAGVGSQVLHGGRVGRRGGHDNGVFHGAVLFELAHHVVDGRRLLADGDVHAGDVLALLADDGVDGNGGLAGLAVADDQLALAAADGHHRVDSLDTGLQRLRHRAAGDYAGRHFFDDVGFLGVDGTLAVDGQAQRVDHAALQLGADRHFENAAGGLDLVAFGHAGVVAQNHGADGVALEVQRHAENIVGKFEHFALHHVGQTVDAGNAVTHGHDGALGANVSRSAQALDAALEQFADLGGIELHIDSWNPVYLALRVRQPANPASGPIGLLRKYRVPGRLPPRARRRSA